VYCSVIDAPLKLNWRPKEIRDYNASRSLVLYSFFFFCKSMSLFKPSCSNLFLPSYFRYILLIATVMLIPQSYICVLVYPGPNVSKLASQLRVMSMFMYRMEHCNQFNCS
jgi:hypothetical protein